MQLTSGLQVLGDQGGVLLSRARITLLIAAATRDATLPDPT